VPDPAHPAPIADFAGRVAVVTGGASGIGRELVVQLAVAGARVATCDLEPVDLPGVVSFVADVSQRADLDAFAAHVRDEFATDAIHLLFNNAGVSAAHSFVKDDEAFWDRIFSVVWGGVLNGTRAFLPMLLAADRAQVVNTSSTAGYWACLGPRGPHTCYAAAKHAVKGFTESLIVDFRMNAPHVTAAVVMPGYVGTGIAFTSLKAMGREVPPALEAQLDAMAAAAPVSAAQAATIILDGVQAGEWRIFVGADAAALDAAVRATPEAAYTPEFADTLLEAGHFCGLFR